MTPTIIDCLILTGNNQSHEHQNTWIAAYLDCALESLTIDRTKKPKLISHPNTHFSVSHTDQFMMICFSNQPIGCDIELLNRAISQRAINRGLETPKYSGESMVKVWTAWEAYCKATGTGLHFPIQTIAFSQSQSFAWQSLCCSVAALTDDFELRVFQIPEVQNSEQGIVHKRQWLPVTDVKWLPLK